MSPACLAAPALTISGQTIPATAAAYPTAALTALAPLSITWGRRDVLAHADPATAAITLALRADRALPATVRRGATATITEPTVGPVFSGTIRDITIDPPTTDPGHATVTITCTDALTAVKAKRLNTLGTVIWKGQALRNIWPAEPAIDRIRRVLRAVTPTAALETPTTWTRDARALLAAPVRAVGDTDDPSKYSVLAWDLLREALAAAGASLHHTPTPANISTWTVVPWGEALPMLPGGIPAVRVPAQGVQVSTSASSQTDLIEVVYYPSGEGIGADLDWTQKERYRSRTLRSNPRTSTRIETGARSTNLPGAPFVGPAIDLLITRCARILDETMWDLSALTPRLSLTSIWTQYLLNPITRCQLQIQLTGLPPWLGLGRTIPTVILGATTTWDGSQWTAALTLTPQSFHP